jgi:polyhydroxyalkanoate synthesis regulator phasin
MVDVIMKDNSKAQAKDVMPELIQSAVQDAIENPEGLDLNSSDGIEDVGWMITDYLEVVTKEKVDVQAVITELKRQLS